MTNDTDIYIITSIFRARGIRFEESKTESGATEISVEGGYVGFVSVMEFDAAGALVKVGAYE